MKAFAGDEKQTAEDREDEGEDEHVGSDLDEQDEGGLQDTGTAGDCSEPRLKKRKSAVRGAAEEGGDFDEEGVDEADPGPDEGCEEYGMRSPDAHSVASF